MIFSESSLNFYRKALNFSLEYRTVMLEGSQRIRRYQIEQIESAISDYSKLSQNLDKGSNSDQLLTTSSELASGQLERIIGYWNGLTNALGQNQIELAGVFQSKAQEATEGLKHQVEQAPAAIPSPFAATMKMMSDVMQNTLGSVQQPMPWATNAAASNGAQRASQGKYQKARGQSSQHH